jgi:HAMP domain-containing protein
MHQRKKLSLPVLPVKRVPLAATTNNMTPSKKLLQDQQEVQKSPITPIKQALAVTPEVITKAVEAASPASSSTSSSSNTTSSTSIAEDLTFASPLPGNNVIKKPINNNEPILQLVPKKDSDTDRFELTEDDGLVTPQPSKVQINYKPHQTPNVVFVDAATNTIQVEIPKTENEEIIHLQAQVRRLQQENSRLSEESSFFRNAANSMKQQAIFGKQQLMSQLEFFCEPLMREAIETDFDLSMRETFRNLFELERSLLELMLMVKRSKKIMEIDDETTSVFDPQTSLLQSQIESLKKDLVQSNRELSQLQSSIKEMCRSWQDRFNLLREEKANLESILEETRQELVSVKNVSDFRSRRKTEQQRKFVDAAVDVNREFIMSDLEQTLANEKNIFVFQEEAEQRNLLTSHFDNSLVLVAKMAAMKKECEKSVSTFSAEAAKYKQRSDRVTGECDRLVEENKKLHEELKDLRKQLYGV